MVLFWSCSLCLCECRQRKYACISVENVPRLLSFQNRPYVHTVCKYTHTEAFNISSRWYIGPLFESVRVVNSVVCT